MTHREHRGFPVIKVLADDGQHIVIDRMEWKDDAIILTVCALHWRKRVEEAEALRDSWCAAFTELRDNPQSIS